MVGRMSTRTDKDGNMCIAVGDNDEIVVHKTITVKNPDGWRLGSPLTLQCTKLQQGGKTIYSLDSDLFSYGMHWLFRAVGVLNGKIHESFPPLVYVQSGKIVYKRSHANMLM